METKLTAEVHLRKDTKYVYSSQCLAAVLRCLPQVSAIVSPEGGHHLRVGLAAVTALNLLLGRYCLLGLASLPGTFSPVLAAESSKAPSFWGT